MFVAWLYCCNFVLPLQLTTYFAESSSETICTDNAHIALGRSHRQPGDTLHDYDCHGPYVHRWVENHDSVGDGAHHLRSCVGYCHRRHFVGAAFCQTPGIYRHQVGGRGIPKVRKPTIDSAGLYAGVQTRFCSPTCARLLTSAMEDEGQGMAGRGLVAFWVLRGYLFTASQIRESYSDQKCHQNNTTSHHISLWYIAKRYKGKQ